MLAPCQTPALLPKGSCEPAWYDSASAPRSTRLTASGGVIFLWGLDLASEPPVKRAVAFFDGQNCFNPSFDAAALGRAVCGSKGWSLVETRFYTGIPDARDNATWNHFWTAKLAQMGREGVVTYSRSLRYRNQRVTLPDGTESTTLVAQEKGIDVRLALDLVRLAHSGAFDVALVFSQDQDLSEAATELRTIARERNRWLKIACAYPVSPTSRNTRGINGTDWIRIERAVFEGCLDARDYRVKG